MAAAKPFLVLGRVMPSPPKSSKTLDCRAIRSRDELEQIIARALAAQGANVTINGFGDKDAIEKERASIEKDYKVEAVYSPADMSKAREIADMVRDSESSDRSTSS